MYNFSFFSNVFLNSWLKDNYLKKIVSQMPREVLLVHSNWAIREGHIDRFKYLSKDKRIDTLLVSNEPSYDFIVKQISDLQDYKLIIGIGSGNVMDVCKLLSMGCSNEEDFCSYIYGIHSKVKKATKRKKLWLFPSHYSSSSWVSQSAVFENDIANYKVSCFGEQLIADKTFIDPNVLDTISDEQWLEMSFDCFAHFYEIYRSVYQLDTFYQKTLEAWLDKFISSLETRDYKSLFYLASFLFSGFIDLSKLEWPIHILSHAIGPYLKVSHTQSLVMLMPYFLQENDTKIKTQYESIFKKYPLNLKGTDLKKLISLAIKMNPRSNSYTNIDSNYNNLYEL